MSANFMDKFLYQTYGVNAMQARGDFVEVVD
jgi:hypothetical protein